MQPRLDGNDVSHFDHVAVGRRQREEWLLMHLEAHSVTERVDVAVEGCGIRSRCRIAASLEKIAYPGLVCRCLSSGPHLMRCELKRREHVGVNLLQLPR